jgi:phosphonate transport system ATP-binding protein
MSTGSAAAVAFAAADLAVAPARVAASGRAIEVSGVRKSFGARRILDSAGFIVESGEAVALIGANGAGKSTLLRLLVRLIEPDAGTIRMLGENVVAADRRQLRALRCRVGFVFQQHNLVGRASVLSNVIHGALGRVPFLAASSHRLAPAALRAEALHCLARVGLADLARSRADRLSGGQSQRVAIARALMQRPVLLLADEPAASLDPVAGEEVMRVFRALVDDDGLTLVFTSHNLEHARRFADRAVGLRGGRVAIDCAADRLDAAAADALYG